MRLGRKISNSSHDRLCTFIFIAALLMFHNTAIPDFWLAGSFRNYWRFFPKDYSLEQKLRDNPDF
jgi:hypothetical protein